MGSLTIFLLQKKTRMSKFKKEHSQSQSLGVAEVGFEPNFPDSKTHILNPSVIFCYAAPIGTQTQASLNGSGQGQRVGE